MNNKSLVNLNNTVFTSSVKQITKLFNSVINSILIRETYETYEVKRLVLLSVNVSLERNILACLYFKIKKLK